MKRGEASSSKKRRRATGKPKAKATRRRATRKAVKKVRQKAKVEKKTIVSVKDLLELRKKISENRPKFVRQESWRYHRLKNSWRKPTGTDSKMRLRVKGWPRLVKVGYRGPRLARGLHPSGLREVLIHNRKELTGLNPKTDAARFAHSLGGRAREKLLLAAKELGVRVLNPQISKPSRKE